MPPYLKDIVVSEFNYMDFSNLNKLLKIGAEGTRDTNATLVNIITDEQDRNLFDSNINQSFLHEIAILYEAEKFI